MPERPDTPLGAQLPHDLHSLRSLPATPQAQGKGATTGPVPCEMCDTPMRYHDKRRGPASCLAAALRERAEDYR